MVEKTKAKESGDSSADASKNDQQELVVVETDEDGKPLQSADGDTAAGEQSADESSADDVSDESDGDEERVGHSEGDDEVEGETVDERRERRKKERKARNIRRKQMGEAKDRQIEQLLSERQQIFERLARVEGRSVQYDVSNIQDKLAQVNAQIAQAKETMAACVKAGDGDGVAEVSDIQYTLRDQKRQLEMTLERAKQAQQTTGAANGGQVRGQQQQRTEPQLSPQAVANAVNFSKSLKWYNPKGVDQDSLVVQAIDNAVHSEGFDPDSTEYWEELEDRVREQLPHRFKSASNGNGADRQNGQQSRQASGPRMAAASGTAPNGGRRLGKNEVYVSPERKAAMQAAGAWDDPKKRAKLLARYAEVDRQSTSEARH